MNKETNHDLIIRSNSSLQYAFDDLNKKREQYLLAVLLAEFKADNPNAEIPEQVKQKTTTLTLPELCNYLGINFHDGRNLESYKNIIKEFNRNAFIQFVDSSTNRGGVINMFEKITYPDKWNKLDSSNEDTNIYFTWSNSFLPHIVCNTHFTKLFKSSILGLSAPSSIKLYQVLKTYCNKDKPTEISVEDLRTKLRMTSKSYNRFDRFYERGIKKPLEEINANTEIHVTATKNKVKNKVVSITFKIRNAEQKKDNWDIQFPDVKLTDTEYNKIKEWITPIHWKKCCIDLQEKLDQGIDIRNHYKWIVSHHENLLTKLEEKTKQKKSEDNSNTISEELQQLIANLRNGEL